jgi:hypothetical protein
MSYRPDTDVGLETRDEVICLAPLPDGPIVILEGAVARGLQVDGAS